MTNSESERENENRKRMIKWLSLLFMGGLLVLTLYSNTLQSMNLPKVGVVYGRQESLVHVYHGEDVLRPATQLSLSNKSGWEISEVLVAEGDSVAKGQVLIIYKNREEEDRYLDAEAQLRQQQLAIEALREAYIEASQNSDDRLMREVRRNLEVAKITLDMQQRNVIRIKESLDSQRALKAPLDGVVRKVNAAVGMTSESMGPDIQFASTSNGYNMQLEIPASISKLVRIEQVIDIQVQLENTTETMSGVIKELESVFQEEGNMQKRLLINVINEKLRGGEQASVKLSIPSEDDDGGILVPNDAIHREGNEAYLFVVEEKKGALGNTRAARKVYVETGDFNEHETVVKGGIFPDAPIILQSSEPIEDGERVRTK